MKIEIKLGAYVSIDRKKKLKSMYILSTYCIP